MVLTFLVPIHSSGEDGCVNRRFRLLIGLIDENVYYRGRPLAGAGWSAADSGPHFIFVTDPRTCEVEFVLSVAAAVPPVLPRYGGETVLFCSCPLGRAVWARHAPPPAPAGHRGEGRGVSD